MNSPKEEPKESKEKQIASKANKALEDKEKIQPNASKTSNLSQSSSAVTSPSTRPKRKSSRRAKPIKYFEFEPTYIDEDMFIVEKGRGVCLLDIPIVANTIRQATLEDEDALKHLYSVMFGRRYSRNKMKLVKSCILQFSGLLYDPEKDILERDRLFERMSKWNLEFLKYIIDFLHIERSKKSFTDEGVPMTKDNLLWRLQQWLQCPNTEGLVAPVANKRRALETNVDKKPKKAKVASSPNRKRRARKSASPKVCEDGEDDTTEGEGDDSEVEMEKLARAHERKIKERVKVNSTPSKQELHKAITEIVAQGDLSEMTPRMVLTKLTERYDTDFSDKKVMIRGLIVQVVSRMEGL